ncbi:DMT family transporter [Parasphingopyxis lamellibrachiae]|uniref:Drug/metabolite transporter (DMT)-like permease n=1 Tax=Parasphingopyxis lamellibrachiae TaxID=680125 RepID=A0A3D9F8J0_9SPHN|nr:DMT family transporter [Parasphingopyxis lamellibrachiae]RED13344.1 drug/metabolite transporter (DMT)-like permease [Parasphingopyxis lamellibrachiae]
MARATSVFLLLSPPAIWGSLVVVGWGALQSLNPLILTLVSWLLAAAVLLILSSANLVRLWDIFRERFLWFVVIGVAGTTGFQFLWYTGLAHGDPVDVTLLTATLPAFICIGDRLLFRAPLSALRISGLAIALAGAAYLAVEGDWSNMVRLQFSSGIYAILGANIMMTVYTLGLRFRMPKCTALELMTLIVVGGLIGFSPLYLVLGHGNPSFDSGGLWIALLYIALFAYVGAYLLWNLSVARNGPSLTGIALYTQPVFALFFAYLILGTGIDAYQWLGGIVILAGLAFAEWSEQRGGQEGAQS